MNDVKTLGSYASTTDAPHATTGFAARLVAIGKDPRLIVSIEAPGITCTANVGGPELAALKRMLDVLE